MNENEQAFILCLFDGKTLTWQQQVIKTMQVKEAGGVEQHFPHGMESDNGIAPRHPRAPLWGTDYFELKADE